MGDFSRIYKGDLTDRQLMAFWDALCAAGRGRSICFDVPLMDSAGFAQWLREPGVAAWLIMHGGRVRGLYFLTCMQGKTAHGPFAMLPMGPERVKTPAGKVPLARAFGMYCVGTSLWEKDANGLPILDTIIGVLPASKTTAVKLVEGTGIGKFFGILPGACWFYDGNVNVPAVIHVYERSSVPAWCAGL